MVSARFCWSPGAMRTRPRPHPEQIGSFVRCLATDAKRSLAYTERMTRKIARIGNCFPLLYCCLCAALVFSVSSHLSSLILWTSFFFCSVSNMSSQLSLLLLPPSPPWQRRCSAISEALRACTDPKMRWSAFQLGHSVACIRTSVTACWETLHPPASHTLKSFFFSFLKRRLVGVERLVCCRTSQHI